MSTEPKLFVIGEEHEGDEKSDALRTGLIDLAREKKIVLFREGFEYVFPSERSFIGIENELINRYSSLVSVYWTAFLFLRHPDWLKKPFDEIKENLRWLKIFLRAVHSSIGEPEPGSSEAATLLALTQRAYALSGIDTASRPEIGNFYRSSRERFEKFRTQSPEPQELTELIKAFLYPNESWILKFAKNYCLVIAEYFQTNPAFSEFPLLKPDYVDEQLSDEHAKWIGDSDWCGTKNDLWALSKKLYQECTLTLRNQVFAHNLRAYFDCAPSSDLSHCVLVGLDHLAGLLSLLKHKGFDVMHASIKNSSAKDLLREIPLLSEEKEQAPNGQNTSTAVLASTFSLHSPPRKMPSPRSLSVEDSLIEQFEAYVTAHPERAAELLNRIGRICSSVTLDK